MEIDREALEEWQKQQPLCILSLDPADRAVLRVAVSVGMNLFEDQWHGQEKTCTSEDCLRVAYEVKRSMDFTADPCEDFYQFTCGGFLQNTYIPEGVYEVDDLSTRNKDIAVEGRLLLEAEPEEGDWELYKTAKTYYKDCVDIDRRNELGISTAKDVLEEAGGWPLLGAENTLEWYEVQKRLARLGINNAYSSIMNFVTLPDLADSSNRVLYLDQPVLELKKDTGRYFINTVYKTHLVKAAVYFGANETEAWAQVEEAVEFEVEMSKIMAPQEKRRNLNLLYHPYSVDALESQNKFPFPAKDYLESLGDLKLTNNDTVVLLDPDYIKELADLISRTDRNDVKNYLFFKAVWNMMPHLDAGARQIVRDFEMEKFGKGYPKLPLWHECVTLLGFSTYENTALGLISSSMYVNKYFKHDAKEQMDEMMANEKLALVDLINNADWMDNSTKIEALLKVEKMTETMGYHDEILDEDIMNDLYRNFTLVPGNYLESTLLTRRYLSDFMMSRVYKKISKENWLDDEGSLLTLVPNAFYNRLSNNAMFTVGIIRGMSFHAEAPRYMNYGAIGTVIGHEIGHGFDDQGRMMDADGNMRNWWSPETSEVFQDKARCVINLFSNLTAEQVGMNIDGVLTQSENIADIMGDRLAYRGYQMWLEENGEEEPGLPGLPFTPQQMFWIAKGRQYCNKIRDFVLRYYINSDTHSPKEQRVNGVVRNNDDFARDFECPVGSLMNPIPEEKCNIW